MITVGIVAMDGVVLSAIRGVLAPCENLCVQFARCIGPGDLAEPQVESVDVLICEPLPLNQLKRVVAQYRALMGMELPILVLGSPPSERVRKQMLRFGARGFVGSSALNFACMPDAVQAVATGRFYVPDSEAVVISEAPCRLQ